MRLSNSLVFIVYFVRGQILICALACIVVWASAACAQTNRAAMSLEKRVIQIIGELALLSESAQDKEALEKRQADLLSELEQIGPSAVPHIVNHMDVRQTLAVQKMRLVNKFPGAFEGYRIYSPRQVVDALAAVLEQITGKELPIGADIYNGEGTDADRDAVVAAWKQYLQNQFKPSTNSESQGHP